MKLRYLLSQHPRLLYGFTALLGAVAIAITSIALPQLKEGLHDARYVPAVGGQTGRELVLILLGANFCRAHKIEGFPQAVEQIKVELAARTKQTGRNFRVVGVALDPRVEEGMRFLRKFGDFDEIVVGGHWTNEAGIKYLWRDIPGRPSVPQIIIVERDVDVGKSIITIKSERVVKRILGADAIIDWNREGSPLPAATLSYRTTP